MNKNIQNFLPIFFFISLFILLSLIGISNYNLNADVSRDLSELSSLFIGKIVWLGPHLRVGFPASPIYYYILFPGVLLSGSAYSTVVTQVIIAVSALIFFFYFHEKRYNLKAFVAVFFLALSPWFIESTIYSWNGHMYVAWLFLSLIFLWYKKPLWLSSLFFGISIAIHPASLLLTPIFLFEAFRYKSKNAVIKICSILLGLFIPWAPIILFELITKGYLIRQWIEHRSTGMDFAFGLDNIQNVATLTGIPLMLLIFMFLLSLVYSKNLKSVQIWHILLLLPVFFLLFISPLHTYYLYPVILTIFFLFTQTLVLKKLGIFLLIICSILFTSQLKNKYSITQTWPPKNRLETITQTINYLTKNQKLNFNNSYAPVSVIDDQNSTPQADDYRFILRTHGYNAVNIDEYPTADYLIIFFENDEKDISNWRDWHTDHFGEKEFIYSNSVNGNTIVVYRRK